MGPLGAIDDLPSPRHGLRSRSQPRLNPQARDYQNGSGNYGFFDGHVETLPVKAVMEPYGDVRYHWPLIPATDGNPPWGPMLGAE